MIGVSPLAGIARAISLLGPLPFFEKARWIDIVPEYNPVKYNSFPANAAVQTARFTRAVQDHLSRAADDQRLDRFPPVLAFQSVVDTTVSTPAVVSDLFDRLPAGGHELVLFDINRQSGVHAFTRPGAVLPRLTNAGPRRYTATLVTNSSADTATVSAMTVSAGSTALTEEPLSLEWPREMFSLSHVALPFSKADPVYGGESVFGEAGGVALGRVVPRGEKDVLLVPLDALMRVSWNPFFPYLAARIEQWID
jgi:alpha-beta hydrolase superfamily lysophospholipase